MSQPEKLPAGSSTPSASQAQENLERSLEAYDQNGDQGLEEALDRIYPPASEEDNEPIPLYPVIRKTPVDSAKYKPE